MMKLLSLLLIAFTAVGGYSVSYYGWTPQKEFSYFFESQVLSGVPEIRSQYSGLKISSEVKIQTFPDYSLRIKFVNPKFVTVNEDVNSVNEKLEVPSVSWEEVPESIREPLVTPFEVHVKHGIVESFFVEKSEPIVVTNLKKALLAQLQMDLGANREGDVQKLNHKVLPQVEESQPETLNISFFNTMETSLHGDCETSYNIHPLPLYQARELEEQWKVEKINLFNTPELGFSHVDKEQVLKDLETAKSICEGKQYYQVTKTRNFENCRERPLFSSVSGVKSFCDPSKSSCEDLMTHLSSSRYIVCGTPEEFTIRKIFTNNMISSSPFGYETEEKRKTFATVTFELLKVETTGYQHLEKPTEPKKIKSLFMEYPEHKTFSSRSIGERMEHVDTSLKERQLRRLTGFYPIQPMPEMTTSPKLLFPISVPKPELYRQVRELINKIVREIFESPESCSSSDDVAGYIMSIAKTLRYLSLDELKEVHTEVLRFVESRNKNWVEKAKFLLFDVYAMVGTNPSTVFVKELIECEEIPREYAPQLWLSALKNVKTPTTELFNMVFSFLKTIKTSHLDSSSKQQLFSVNSITFSDLLYRACMNPTTMVAEFPVHVYGNFCNPESSFIKEQYIPYLITEVDSSSHLTTPEHIVLVKSLGKLGHYEAIKPLVKFIEGKISKKPLVRSLAVYSLKRVAVQYPSKVKPILMSLIGNPAEHPEVRIAAVSILPFCSPSTAELNKIALRTWFEPSKQVASFIYSTFSSLKESEIPELLNVRSRVQNVVSMIKPVESGIQFSHNLHSSKFLEYLKLVRSNRLQWVNTERSFVPSKIAYSTSFLTKSYNVKGLSWILYTEGMDYVLEKLVSFFNFEGVSSQTVRAGLQKLNEKLGIKKREVFEPEAHLHLRMAGLERIFSFNSDLYVETLGKISEQLQSKSSIFNNKKTFEYSKAEKLAEVQVMGPTDAGFPLFSEVTVPLVVSLKGHIQVNTSTTPSTTGSMKSVWSPVSGVAKITPVLNIKGESSIGVISPFTKQYIGVGVETTLHSSLPLVFKASVNSEGQVELKVKSPEQIVGETEVFHAKVRPFTFKKSLEAIVPVSQSSGSKTIVSQPTLKTFKYNPLQSLMGIDTPTEVSTDYSVMGLGVLVEKVSKTPDVWSAVQTTFLPTSLRYLSVKARFNPTVSETKELVGRFSFAQGFKSSSSEPVNFNFPTTYSNKKEEIRQICSENHNSEFEISRCVSEEESSHVSDVSRESRELCERLVKSEESLSSPEYVEKVERCIESVKMCDQTEAICRRRQHRNVNMFCKERKNKCMMNRMNLLKVRSVLGELEQGKAVSFTVEGSTNTRYEKKSVSAIFTLGSRLSGYNMKHVVEVDVTTPIFENVVLRGEAETRLPEIKAKWDLEQLINDDLKMESDLVLRYGIRGTPKHKMEKIILKTEVTKTESQKQSIRQSNEYKRCVELVSQGRELAPICEKVRHEASSLDKLMLKIETPFRLTDNVVISYIRQGLDVLFYPYIRERIYDSTSSLSNLKSNEATFEALVSRQGEEAEIKFRHPGFEMEMRDVRLNPVFKNVLPLSIRNGVSYRLWQKVTSQQSPASCRIENEFVTTFDNKTYQYSLNDCEHLLVKDCSGVRPLAVTARGSSSQKEVKIFAGLSVVEMRPTSGSVSNGIYIDGKQVRLIPGEIKTVYTPKNKVPTLEIVCYLDGSVTVREFQTSLEVTFNGKNIEVVTPFMVRSRVCGICGDMNGESTSDLLTPQKCVFRKSRIAAYTYMIKDSCQGVPTQDLPEYEEELHKCVKKSFIPTPLEDLTRRLIRVKSGPSGLIEKHVVEYRANGNEICFSKFSVAVCLKGSVPKFGKMSSMPFTCVRSQSTAAKHMLSRVMANEHISQLSKYPTSYTRMMEEASECVVRGDDIMSSQGESYHHSSSSSKSGRFQPQIYNY